MIKVGQKYLFEEKQTFEVMYILENKMILYSKEKGAYDYNKYWLEEELEDGKTRLIEDVPSIEEQLKGLGIEIEKQEERNNILFYRIDYYSKLRMEWAVRYNYNRKRFVYNTSIGIEQNKLILQYIEENEK